MACKVGLTNCKPQQILQAASWLFDQLPSYDLFDANCQYFAMAMVIRSVIRLCDRTILTDSKTQVVAWSLEREHQPHVNVTKRAFVIGPLLSCRHGLRMQSLSRGSFAYRRIVLVYVNQWQLLIAELMMNFSCQRQQVHPHIHCI